jgi:hypothetical protein
VNTAEIDITIPVWLRRSASPVERAAAWAAEPKRPAPIIDRRPSPDELRIAESRARDEAIRHELEKQQAAARRDATAQRIAKLKAGLAARGRA